MTYTESAALMTDADFRGRVKVSCLKFAQSIMDELGSIPAHNTQMRWATQCFQQPDIVAGQTQPPTVMDPGVQSAGAAIDDAGLQGAVEATINKMM
jgi:hypothetical protein